MQRLTASARSLCLGGAVAALAALVLWLFAGAFEVGATWSPVTQTGGPGFLFVVGPALIGWFWLAGWVRRSGLAAIGEALVLSVVAAIAVGAGALVLATSWPTHPAVLESLYSAVGVALVVSTISSVSVRLVGEPHLE